MKVICIDTGTNTYLTIGKMYELLNIIEDDDIGYQIKNDSGNYIYYMKERFISLAEYREQQINDLLN